jgi:hypothetical protein
MEGFTGFSLFYLKENSAKSSGMEITHRNPRCYARRSMFKKGRIFFSSSPPYFVK